MFHFLRHAFTWAKVSNESGKNYVTIPFPYFTQLSMLVDDLQKQGVRSIPALELVKLIRERTSVMNHMKRVLFAVDKGERLDPEQIQESQKTIDAYIQIK